MMVTFWICTACSMLCYFHILLLSSGWLNCSKWLLKWGGGTTVTVNRGRSDGIRPITATWRGRRGYMNAATNDTHMNQQAVVTVTALLQHMTLVWTSWLWSQWQHFCNIWHSYEPADCGHSDSTFATHDTHMNQQAVVTVIALLQHMTLIWTSWLWSQWQHFCNIWHSYEPAGCGHSDSTLHRKGQLQTVQTQIPQMVGNWGLNTIRYKEIYI